MKSSNVARYRSVVLLALFFSSTATHAHGAEALVFAALLYGAAFGILTGAPIPGVPPTRIWEDALAIAALQAYGGALPLIAGFLCADPLARRARARWAPARQG